MSSRLLVVDDEEMIRDTISIHLEKMGHEVVLAEDGEEAIELLNKEKFDLVFTDMRMPKIGGEEVLAAVKMVSPTTPLIIMSGFIDSLRSPRPIRTIAPSGSQAISPQMFTSMPASRAASMVPASCLRIAGWKGS